MFDIDLLGFMEFLAALGVFLSVCMSRYVIVFLSLPLSLLRGNFGGVCWESFGTI